MLRGIYSILIIAVICMANISSVFAQTPYEQLPDYPIIITEIYANAPGSSESGNEYVEVYNQTDVEIDLTGATLRRIENNNNIQNLDGINLQPFEYKAIYTTFPLLNSGGTLALDLPDTILSAEIPSMTVDYPSLADTESWSLMEEEWQKSEPTPNEPNFTPSVPEPEPDPIPEETYCLADEIQINEILANPAGADTGGGEFVELHNTGQTPVSLEKCLLATDKMPEMELPAELVEPDDYYVVWLADKLLNGGGSVTFITHTSETIVEYPELSDDQAWGLFDKQWQLVEPTPGNTNRLAAAEEQDPDINSDCIAPDITINEIMANPAGADTGGGEFVELYNNGQHTVDLNGCNLSTDKAANIELTDTRIEPNAYYAVMLADKLLNNGGTVTFMDSQSEQSIAYPALEDNQAWALVNGVWVLTYEPTPGSTNVLATVNSAVSSNQDNTLSPCPAGKFRNPETNRCKNIVDTASSLLPCKAGQVRNPETNRCRNILGTISRLVPCKTGYERNPETNRCRKSTSTTTTALKPCQPGYERNTETNRCRKLSTLASQAAAFPVSGPAPLHPGILLSMSALALVYGAYEYRLDLGNFINRAKKRFLKN